MDYSVDAGQTCSAPTPPCQTGDFGWVLGSYSLSQKTEARFTIETAGRAAVNAAELQAPLSISSWSHGHAERYGYSQTPCGTSGARNLSDSNLQLDAGDPSYLNAAISLTSGAAVSDVTVALVPPLDTEPRFGWTYPTGLRWTDSTRYPSVLVTENGEGHPDCFSDATYTAYLNSRGPFDPFPQLPRTTTESTPTSAALPGCSPVDCTVRVQGGMAWTYPSSFEEKSFFGGGRITWSFDVRVTTDSTDGDGDGVLDDRDNCPAVANGGQENLDGDGQGDACDDDVDGDGLSNSTETAAGSDPRSSDGDGDGIPDTVETNNGSRVDTDGDGTVDAADQDSDGDGKSDTTEGSADGDGDGVPNWRDRDLPPAPVNVLGGYAFVGAAGFARGGATARLTGLGAPLVTEVCFRSSWTAEVRARDSVQVKWNEQVAAGLHLATPQNDEVVDVRNESGGSFWNPWFKQTVVLEYCLAPTAIGSGQYFASYPLEIQAGTNTGRIFSVSQSTSISIATTSQRQGPLDIRASSSRGATLRIGWFQAKRWGPLMLAG